MKIKNVFFFLVFTLFVSLSGGIKEYLCFLSAVLVHELGHALCALLLGVKITSVRFGVFGIRMYCDFYDTSVFRVLAVCFAGPLAGFIASFAITSERLTYFSAASLILSVFNLLPITSLDGGIILKTVAESFMLPDRSYLFCKTVGSTAVIVFFALAVRTMLRGEPSLPILASAVYMIFGGVIES